MNEKRYGIGNEDSGHDDAKLGTMLRSLDRVGAPKDFEFRLKARLAESGGRRLRGPVLRLRHAAAALAAILLLAAAFTLLMTDRPVDERAGTSVKPVPAASDETATREAAPGQADLPALSGKTDEPAVARTGPVAEPARRLPAVNNRAVEGVREEGYSIPPTINLNVNSATSDHRDVNPNPGSETSIGIGEIFLAIGISAQAENNLWKVRSVTENGLAQRSGVLAGDVIEAIDNVKLSAKTSVPRSFSGRTITVSRGGRSVVLNLGSR